MPLSLLHAGTAEAGRRAHPQAHRRRRRGRRVHPRYRRRGRRGQRREPGSYGQDRQGIWGLLVSQQGRGAREPAGAVILACEMIEDEVRLALEGIALERRPPLVWVESGLHDRPQTAAGGVAGADRPARRRCPRRHGRQPPFRPSRAGPGCGASARGARRARSRKCSSLSVSAARHSRIGRPTPDAWCSRGWTTASRCCSIEAVREEIPRNPRSYYLTRGWFCHDNSMARPSRTGTSALVPSVRLNCARPCSPATSRSA